MTQITEDYVSFETAKLLKDKGFQAKCTACYRSDLNYKFELVSGRINYCNPKFSKYKMIPPYNAPTLQMVMKWLNENHNLYVFARPYVTEDGVFYLYEIKRLHKFMIEPVATETGFEKSEQACEAAIKYCLENLI